MNHLQQEFQYTVLYPTGEEDVVSTLDIFLDRLLNHLPVREPPPLEVLNKLLTLENLDYGMSGGLRWPSFSLTSSLYEEFLKAHNL